MLKLVYHLICFSRGNFAKVIPCYLFALFFICKSHADLAQETIYLTWKQAPSTSMTIQWISDSNNTESVIAYHPIHASESVLKTTGTKFPFPYASQYLIHCVELSDLLPDTEYAFSVQPFSQTYRFITAPLRHEKELHFVVGGDMYHDDISFVIETCKIAAQTNPLFALVGGDIAYAVKSQLNAPQKIDRWIEWIKTWHANMVTPEGRLIPVIAAIGNHDLIGQFGQTPQQATIFSALFPMPGPQIYNSLDFNDYLTLFILDSGHANPITGSQAQWLEKSLEKRTNTTHRFAIYHVPAYPSVRHKDNPYSVAIRKTWVPLFEKWRLHAAFENHDHAYKRTHPLIQGKIHSQGIIYLGDGAWGVETPRTQRTPHSYIAKFSPTRHFIAITLTPNSQYFRSISDKGKVLDEYLQVFTKEDFEPKEPAV